MAQPRTTLRCRDGEVVVVSTALLATISPVFDAMPRSSQDTELRVDDPHDAWVAVLALAQALVTDNSSSVGVTWDQAASLYTLADKYAIRSCLTAIHRTLCIMAHTSLSCTCTHPAYALRWLEFAERFQLQQLRDLCMGFVERNLCHLEVLQRPVVTCCAGSQCSQGPLCRCLAPSPATQSVIIGSAVRQLQHFSDLWQGINATLCHEGLAWDPVQDRMRITDWNSWRRLGAPAPRQAARRSLTVNVSDADVQCAVA